MENKKPTPEKIDALYRKLNTEAEQGGYHLNPDIDFTKALIEGLIVNEERYGYRACPCRLASGDMKKDLDIICPCDYRDADLNDFDACYCGLYVGPDIIQGKKELKSIPERRDAEKAEAGRNESASALSNLKYPVWRCSVCGYLCAKENPPSTCPICKVGKERFERFM